MTSSSSSDWEEDYGSVTARYYDLAYANRAELGADVGFYHSLAREAGGPVLELGCGTGRVLLGIAREGIACTGVDASRHMLEAFRAKAGELPSLRLVRARMQDFDLGQGRFALIFSAFRAFQHLYTVEDQLACLARVRRHLAPEGALAFDVFNPRLSRLAPDREPEAEDTRFELPDGDEVVRHTAVIERDPSAQIQQIQMRYERRRAGQVVASQVTRFAMRWFYRFELEHLAARAGFRDVEIFGDFDRTPPGPGTPALVVLAR